MVQQAITNLMSLQEAAWLEQQEALLAMQAAMPVQPIYTRVPAKKLRTPELDDAESQQYSPYPRFSRCATQLPHVSGYRYALMSA